MSCALVFLAVVAVAAQGAGTTANSEIVSVRPAAPTAQGWSVRAPAGGRFVADNVPLKNLVEIAYRVNERQLVWAHDALAGQRYTIRIVPAKPGAGSDPGSLAARLTALKPVLRTVLEEKFQLRSHWMNRATKVYELEVEKGGAKLQAPTAADEARHVKDTGSAEIDQLVSGPGTLAGYASEMGTLAATLSRMLGAEVVDQTGLKGKYTFTLHWTPENTMLERAASGSNAPAVSLPMALRDQLGLELKSGKETERVLVIDHVQAPGAEGNGA